jgi:hypothetical protein
MCSSGRRIVIASLLEKGAGRDRKKGATPRSTDNLHDSWLDFSKGPNTIARLVALKYFTLFLFALLVLVRSTDAVVIGQIDDFQDGTTANWTNGEIIGVTPVTNIASGGPAGAGDRFIQITSDGNGAGGRLTVFNRDQWLGDYVGGGITAIEVDLRNQGAVNLSIRLAFKNGPGNGVPGYLSQVMSLAAGSGWQHFTISLAPANLIPVGNPLPWNQFFIGEVRFINAPGTGDLNGTPVVGQLGIDNVHAVPEPAVPALLVVSSLVGVGLRLRRPQLKHESPSA